MLWQPGTQLFGDRYTILKHLKTGGFGFTYLVKNRQDQTFVLKTLNDAVMSDPEHIPFRDQYLQNFDRETAKLAICRHRHIVEVENHFFHDDRPCMVMEYIQGQDLADRLRTGPLPEAIALRYIRQIGDALTLVHAKGLLHRDLKPANIMVRLPADEAVLIDFGIAREFIPNLTQTHTYAITPCFAPIEQYEPQEHRGEFTDVYALAATLYNLLTAQLPPISTMRIRRDRLHIPSTWSPELQAAIRQGMAVEPEDRPPTIAAWLDLLPPPPAPEPANPESANPKPASQPGARPTPGNLPSFRFEFETVRVNAQGKIIETIPGQTRYYTQDLGQGTTLDLVPIPGGTFQMGTEAAEIERLSQKYDRDYFRCEHPRHPVQVAPFWLGKTPITQDQWRSVVTQVGTIARDLNPDPSNFKGGNRPVERVSWLDAIEFCARLTRLTGTEYRLPSEAEWEYACRAGTTTPFHCGPTLTTALANYSGNDTFAEEPKGEYRQHTSPVGEFPPNPWGLYDLHGNVWEWCLDPWRDTYVDAPQDGRVWDETIDENDNRYQKPSENLGILLEAHNNRVLRGGSWDYAPGGCRAASRDSDSRDPRYVDIGFRVVCVAPSAL
jgi:formylglycine-generating enzyme required for sulfatase activity